LAVRIVPRRSVADEVAALLDSPEVADLIGELEALNWTGQKGYGPRALVGACLVKSLYALPTWTRTARLIAEHHALADVLGGTPSHWACYRFARKLREHSDRLADCLDRIAAALHAALPEYGTDVAIDASDLPAYANGQRFLSKNGPERETYSDPDASWGHRSAVSTRKGGGFYGYRLHAAVCAKTGLPLAWEVKSAREHESLSVPALLATIRARGFKPETAALDMGYDVKPVYEACSESGCAPIIPLRKTPAVKRGEHRAPTCEHGHWTFAGADFKRGAAKWRCPTGECSPASTWIKADRLHPLVPRETKRWGDLYRGRASVEREFGRLKNEYGLKPLRVRGLAKVALHTDLTMLARLSQALARARVVPIPLAA
jgi:transposase, IS5 family